jgi:hypothetical protein
MVASVKIVTVVGSGLSWDGDCDESVDVRALSGGAAG